MLATLNRHNLTERAGVAASGSDENSSAEVWLGKVVSSLSAENDESAKNADK